MIRDPQGPARPADAGTAAGERPRLLALPNGEKYTPTFSRTEMDRRMQALRAHMVERAVDACLFTSIHNINYFADFVYCGFGRHYGLLVTGDTETTITANIDYGQPWRRGVSDNLVYTDWQRDNFFHAVRTLAVKGGSRRIGIEYDHVTLETRAKLEAALPEAVWIDIAPATMRLRLFRSAEEQALIRSGAEISDLGGGACLDAIVEGAPEYEVARHATSTMVREIARRHPDTDLMDTWTWFQSGINTDGAHNPVTARRLRRGDIMSLNCFAMISGY